MTKLYLALLSKGRDPFKGNSNPFTVHRRWIFVLMFADSRQQVLRYVAHSLLRLDRAKFQETYICEREVPSLGGAFESYWRGYILDRDFRSGRVISLHFVLVRREFEDIKRGILEDPASNQQTTSAGRYLE